MNISPICLDSILLVSTLVSGTLIVNVVYKSYIVEMVGKELNVDLITLDMGDFNVILGINWLTAYHITIDCYKKKLVFNVPNEKPFSY